MGATLLDVGLKLMEKQLGSAIRLFLQPLWHLLQITQIKKWIYVIPECVSLVQLLDCEQVEPQMKSGHMAAFLLPLPLSSCQHKHFSGCNSFTVAILRLARKPPLELWKLIFIFQVYLFFICVTKEKQSSVYHLQWPAIVRLTSLLLWIVRRVKDGGISRGEKGIICQFLY